MKCLLLVLSAALLPFCGFAGRFAPNPVSERRCITASEMRILFSDGVPQFEIVIPRNAPPAAKFAAEELAKHLGKVLGCQLEILNEKSGKKPALIVGDAALALKNGMDVSKLDRDGFFIRSIGDDILIVGSDSPQRISTWTERATLFAVYDFLERFAGVRFYFPGETGTVTPRVKEWKLPVKIDLMERPDFQYRRMFTINLPRVSGRTERVVWYEDVPEPMERYRLAEMRNRMQTRDIPNCHGLVALGLKERFAKTHPEYFALDTQGMRKNGTNYSHPNDAAGQICFSSKGLFESVFLDAKAVLTNRPQDREGMLGSDGKIAWHKHFRNFHTMGEIFCVMPNDSCYLCRCPECLPHFKGSTAGNYTQETTDYIWKFMSGIAQRVKDAGIPGYVTTMAYSQYRGIPSFSLPDNMIVMLAVTGPWNEGKSQQKKDERLLRDWQKKLNGKTYLWTYPSKYWVSVRGIPNMAPQAFGDFYRRQSPCIFGAFAEAETDRWIFGYLNYYVFGKVMWDKNTDVRKLLDEHHRLMFGAAAPQMKEFYDTLERHWINEICGSEVNTPTGPTLVVPSDEKIWTEIYSEAECGRIEALFRAAEAAAAKDPDSLRRVKFMYEKLWKPVMTAAADYRKMVSDNSDWNAVMPEVPAGEKVVVDGKMEEAFWKQVKPFYLVPKNGANDEAVRQQTLCRAARDKDNFYFFFRSMEPETAKLRAPSREKDAQDIWQDNCLELFLAPARNAENGCQFIINSAGSSSDNRFGPGYTDWKWDGGAEFKIHVEPGKYWDLEIRIPRRNPGMLSGDSIMANVCRHRVVDGEKNSYDTWSPFVTGSNRKISAYGELLFQAPEDNNLIDTPDFDKPVRGKRFIGKWFAGKVLPTDAQIFRTGGASVVLNAENESVGQYLPQLKSNAKYRLSYYIRTKDVKPLTKQDSGVYVRVELANGKPVILPGARQNYKGTMPWTRQSFEFKTPEIRTKGTHVYIRFTMHKKLTSGTAWIDKVKLEELP